MASRDRVVTESNIVDFEPQNCSNDAEYTLIVITETSLLEVHSVVASAPLAEGSALCIVNDSAVSIKLVHDGSGTAGARFLMDDAADIVLPPRGKIWAKLVEESSNHTNGWWFESL